MESESGCGGERDGGGGGGKMGRWEDENVGM